MSQVHELVVDGPTPATHPNPRATKANTQNATSTTQVGLTFKQDEQEDDATATATSATIATVCFLFVAMDLWGLGKYMADTICYKRDVFNVRQKAERSGVVNTFSCYTAQVIHSLSRTPLELLLGCGGRIGSG